MGRFVFRVVIIIITIIFLFITFFSYYIWCGEGGRLPVLMLIGGRATNMSSMSSGEERNVGERSGLCLPNLALRTGC